GGEALDVLRQPDMSGRNGDAVELDRGRSSGESSLPLDRVVGSIFLELKAGNEGRSIAQSGVRFGDRSLPRAVVRDHPVVQAHSLQQCLDNGNQIHVAASFLKYRWTIIPAAWRP